MTLPLSGAPAPSAPAAAIVEHLPWAEFLDSFAWTQQEHVTLVGPTGGGKTTLALAILPRRRFRVILVSKPKDATFSGLTSRKTPKAERYHLIRQWPPPPGVDRVLLWPKIDRVEHMANQAAVFDHALKSIYAEGAWCPVADDLYYLYGVLGIRKETFELLWSQGRSNNVPFVAGVQRPAHVPLMAYDQATHLFFWRDNDESNLKRIGGIGWLNAKQIRSIVAGLPLHHVLYVNSRTGRMVVTRVERPRP